MKDVASASLVVNWLNTQRGLGGGFVSTQVILAEKISLINHTTYFVKFVM